MNASSQISGADASALRQRRLTIDTSRHIADLLGCSYIPPIPEGFTYKCMGVISRGAFVDPADRLLVEDLTAIGWRLSRQGFPIGLGIVAKRGTGPDVGVVVGMSADTGRVIVEWQNGHTEALNDEVIFPMGTMYPPVIKDLVLMRGRRLIAASDWFFDEDGDPAICLETEDGRMVERYMLSTIYGAWVDDEAERAKLKEKIQATPPVSTVEPWCADFTLHDFHAGAPMQYVWSASPALAPRIVKAVRDAVVVETGDGSHELTSRNDPRRRRIVGRVSRVSGQGTTIAIEVEPVISPIVDHGPMRKHTPDVDPGYGFDVTSVVGGLRGSGKFEATKKAVIKQLANRIADTLKDRQAHAASVADRTGAMRRFADAISTPTPVVHPCSPEELGKLEDKLAAARGTVSARGQVIGTYLGEVCGTCHAQLHQGFCPLCKCHVEGAKRLARVELGEGGLDVMTGSRPPSPDKPASWAGLGVSVKPEAPRGLPPMPVCPMRVGQTWERKGRRITIIDNLGLPSTGPFLARADDGRKGLTNGAKQGDLLISGPMVPETYDERRARELRLDVEERRAGGCLEKPSFGATWIATRCSPGRPMRTTSQRCVRARVHGATACAP